MGEAERGLSAVEFTRHPFGRAAVIYLNLFERVDNVSRDV